MTKTIVKKGMSTLCALALVASLFAGAGNRASAATSNWDGVIPAANASYSFSGGSGTSGSPYQINTAADLAQLSANVRGGTVYLGMYFRMTEDISLSPASASDATVNTAVSGVSGYTGSGTVYEWLPIGGGATNYSFKGHFDGNGKTIYNVFYNQPIGGGSSGNAVGNNVGLFGKLEENASIKNVTISGGYIGAQRSVGGLVGKSWGDIDNCVNNGTVVYSNQSKGVGGLVGANWVNSASNPPSILNSANHGKVISGYSGGSAGGIAGENEGAIINCYNTGAITSPYNAGGLVGSNKNNYNNQTKSGGTIYGGISNSYNAGAIDGKVAGGIAGYQMGTMRNCYNIGAITGSSYAGQLIGELSSSLTNDPLYYSSAITVSAVGHVISGTYTADTFGSSSGDKDDLLAALNDWVANEASAVYQVWTIVTGTNSGYPIL